MNRRVIAILFSIIVLLGACGSSDSGFTADRGRIDAQLEPALGEDVDPRIIPGVQRRFLDMCFTGGESSAPDLPPIQLDGLLAVCGCTYDSLVTFLRDNAEVDGADDPESAAYEAFTKIEDDVRRDGEIDPDVAEVVADCIRAEAGL